MRATVSPSGASRAVAIIAESNVHALHRQFVGAERCHEQAGVRYARWDRAGSRPRTDCV
jgi:hypothetical protein